MREVGPKIGYIVTYRLCRLSVVIDLTYESIKLFNSEVNEDDITMSYLPKTRLVGSMGCMTMKSHEKSRRLVMDMKLAWLFLVCKSCMEVVKFMVCLHLNELLMSLGGSSCPRWCNYCDKTLDKCKG